MSTPSPCSVRSHRVGDPAISESMASILDQTQGLVDLDLAAGSVRVEASRAEAGERRELLRLLGQLIYEHHHVGHRVDDGLDVSAGRDEAYESWLCDLLADRTITQRVRVHDLGRDDAVVTHLGLRVRVPRSALSSSGARPELGGLEVPLLAPALSPGFALARGSGQPTDGGSMLRVYFGSCDRDDATSVFLRVLDALRDRVGWQAKVASQTRLYPRSDAVTVYLGLGELDCLDDLVVAGSRSAAASAPTSRFARALASGVGCAWEPEHPHPTRRSVSFGQHRARVLSRLLVARTEGSWRDGDTEQACRDRGIDPDHVWRNLTSPDLELPHRPVRARPADLAGLHP